MATSPSKVRLLAVVVARPSIVGSVGLCPLAARVPVVGLAPVSCVVVAGLAIGLVAVVPWVVFE